MQFEWDPAKDAVNQKKHGINFQEAATLFGDRLAITISDPDHLEDEQRFLTTGTSERGRVMIIAHPDREDRIRIISARPVTARERRIYEERDEQR
jgi:uncharacterized DUF497 family protein